jgi:hypothetical protein
MRNVAMEDIMKKDLWPALVLGCAALILTAGLLFTGCGSNQGPASADSSRADVEAEPAEPADHEAEGNPRAAVQDAHRDAPAEAATPRHEPAAHAPQAAMPARQPERPPEPTTVMVKLPADTQLSLEFLDAVSSETSLPGDPVRARIIADVVGDGVVALPAGSQVFGIVTEAVAQKKIGGQAKLSVRFDQVETPSGYRAAIQATLDVQGKSQKKKDAAVIGGSAAGGAVLGRVLGDDSKDALIGGIVGAAAGTIAASQNKADPVVIEPGVQAVVALELPIHVVVTSGSQPATLARN